MAGTPLSPTSSRLPGGLLALLLGGCVFNSQGLPSSAAEDGGAAPARDARLDSKAVIKDLPKKLDKPKPPPDTKPKSCPKGKILCAEACVDPNTDNKNCGNCGITCLSTETCMTGLCCIKSWANCAKQCVNLKADVDNCGACGAACKINEACAAGKCCPVGATRCGNACANLQTDAKHCGACGTACKAGEKCQAAKCVKPPPPGGCVANSAEQKFGGGMVGCAGKVSWPKRDTLCNGAKYRVCGAAEWVAKHGPQAPKFNYWTNDVLHYGGTEHYCVAHPSWGTKCWPDMPMRVCVGGADPLGNKCNWNNCGYIKPTPNHYFGGCNDNPTAGTLCCPK